jgi:hypothetical protein
MVKRFGAVLLAVGFGVRRSALAFFGSIGGGGATYCYVVFDKI